MVLCILKGTADEYKMGLKAPKSEMLWLELLALIRGQGLTHEPFPRIKCGPHVRKKAGLELP